MQSDRIDKDKKMNKTIVIKKIYTNHFIEVFNRCSPELMAKINAKISPYTTDIAKTFYRVVIDIEGSDQFINHGLVKTQLTSSMSLWVADLFYIREGQELDKFIEAQLKVGHVHARINLPPHLFNCGIRVLKQRIHYHLRQEGVTLKEYNDMTTLASMLIDLCTSLMNESFFDDIVVGERKSQALQQHMSGAELALKCEQLRSDTFSWQTQFLNMLRDPDIIIEDDLQPIMHSDVGLWITHKAGLFFPASELIHKIQNELEEVDKQVKAFPRLMQLNTHKEYNEAIQAIDKKIKLITSLLSSLVEHSISLESGRDPLTKLLNRRYLDTVLQKETMYCMRRRESYVVMLIDIDFFKSINDNYGHDSGDRVLEQMGETLSHNIRASDFIFRYGGEEFLILLAEMKVAFVKPIVEKLMNTVRTHKFNIGRDKPLNLTVSVGIAAHQQHPDYNRVINNADKALYQAKETGRDKYVIYEEADKFK